MFFIDLDNEGYHTKSPRVYILLGYEETSQFLKLNVKFNDEKIILHKKKKYCFKVNDMILYSEGNMEFFNK